MKGGYIADVVIALFVIVTVAICTKNGFMRSVLHYASMFIALSVAIVACNPLAKFCDHQWGWASAMENWNVPFISGATLLVAFCAVGLFLFVRLVLLLLDKLLAYIKERVHSVNVVDRCLGFLFGIVVAAIEITSLFMLIDLINAQEALQLTAKGGSIYAQYLFNYAHEYLFPVVSKLFAAIEANTPKI